MSDNTLTTLMGNVPSRFVANMWLLFSHLLIYSLRCILLLEDLDAAFTRSVSRDEKSTGAPIAATSKEAAAAETTDGSTLSLSGLLNSLDGVAAAEGRYVYLLPLCIPFNF
jgi:chaperone BCS1